MPSHQALRKPPSVRRFTVRRNLRASSSVFYYSNGRLVVWTHQVATGAGHESTGRQAVEIPKDKVLELLKQPEGTTRRSRASASFPTKSTPSATAGSSTGLGIDPQALAGNMGGLGDRLGL